MIETGSHSSDSKLYEGQVRASLLEGNSGSVVRKLPGASMSGTRTHNLTGLTFRGRLEIEGIHGSSPTMQDFTIYQPTATGFIIRNHPVVPTPSIEIELAASSTNSPFQVLRFGVRATGETVDGEIEYTRLFFALATASKCTLRDKGGEILFSFEMQGVSSEGMENCLYRAKLFRKLKFIESVFHTQFRLPTDIAVEQVQQLEIVFRGVTEGEFAIREDGITFYDYAPARIEDLNRPPFTDPGSFTQWVGNNAAVFDRLLDVGPVSVHLDRTVVANSRLVDKLRSGETVSQLSFVVFDHQIRHNFEKYAARSPQSRRLKLEQFKKRLLAKEPEALVSLLEEPLASDVSAEEAIKIANGWLQFNMFPDRYCPQEPRLEAGRWTIPVWVTYPNGRGAQVQDAYVDLKTGAITVPITVEEFRNRGKTVAAECLRAS